jgi:hypothetical protein
LIQKELADEGLADEAALGALLEVAVVEQAAAGDAPLADLKPRGGDAVEVGAAAALADDDVDRAGVGGGGEADGVALGLDRGEVAGRWRRGRAPA